MRGGDKLLEQVDGMPQLRRAVEAARRSGAVKIWVTLAPEAAARTAALAGSWAKRLVVPDWEEGMAASLRAGARAASAQRAAGLIVLLPDMPEIEAADVARLVEAHGTAPEAVWRAASAEGAPGHPVLVPARLFQALAALQGDAGARTLLAAEGPAVQLVRLAGGRAVTDLDTPEDWAAWRARRGH